MVGFAPRGRRELRHLLDVADLDHALPSTLWERADSGTWRTGIAGADQPAWQAAAFGAGSVTAWRTFTSEDGHALELQVIPMASAADVDAALASFTDPARPLRRGGAPAADDRVEAATAGAHVVVAVGSGDAWEPSDLAVVVAAQVAKLT